MENKAKLRTLIGLPVLFVLLSMVCTPVFTCFKCCCVCCKPDKTEKFEKKCDPFKSLVVMTVFTLSIVLLIGSTYWAVNMHRTIDRSQPLMCSVVTMLHDIQHGYKDDKITFAGIGGSIYFLDTLKTETEKLKDSKSMDNIINRDLGTTAKEYSDSVTAFYNKFKENTVKGCKPTLTVGSGTDIIPGVIKTLTDNINDAVKAEKEKYTQMADKIHSVATNVKQLASNGAATTFLSQLDKFIATLKLTSKRIDEAKTNYVKKVKYEQVAGWMRLGLWVITGTIAFLLITNLLIMFCTLHWKCCLGMNILSKLLMTLKLTIGGAISSLSITFMTVGIISSNFCTLFKESMEDKEILKGFLPEYPYTFAENCIYADSKGVLTFLEDKLGSFS